MRPLCPVQLISWLRQGAKLPLLPPHAPRPGREDQGSAPPAETDEGQVQDLRARDAPGAQGPRGGNSPRVAGGSSKEPLREEAVTGLPRRGRGRLRDFRTSGSFCAEPPAGACAPSRLACSIDPRPGDAAPVCASWPAEDFELNELLTTKSARWSGLPWASRGTPLPPAQLARSQFHLSHFLQAAADGRTAGSFCFPSDLGGKRKEEWVVMLLLLK
ncbi:unnamed protein product, partial [Effrenium voratum]